MLCFQALYSSVLTNTYDWYFLSTNNSAELLGVELEHLYEDSYHLDEPSNEAHHSEPWSFLYVDTEDVLDQPVRHTNEGVGASTAVEPMIHSAAASETGHINDAIFQSTQAAFGYPSNPTTTTIDGTTVAEPIVDPSETDAQAVSSQMARCLSTLQTYFGGVHNVHVTRYESSSHTATTVSADPATPLTANNKYNATVTNFNSNPDPPLNVIKNHHDVVLHTMTCSDVQELDTLLPKLWAFMKPNNSLHVMVLSRRVDSSVDGITRECFDAVTSATTNTNTNTAGSVNTSATTSTAMIPLPSHSTMMKCCPLDDVIGAKCVYFRYDTQQPIYTYLIERTHNLCSFLSI